MRLVFEGNKLRVIREKGDKKYYGIINAAGESRLLYAIAQQLKKLGYDVIKKRMWKDGHLKDDMQQYIRERKANNGSLLCWYNNHWAINGLDEDFNKGEAVLTCDNLV